MCLVPAVEPYQVAHYWFVSGALQALGLGNRARMLNGDKLAVMLLVHAPSRGEGQRPAETSEQQAPNAAMSTGRGAK